MNEFNDATGHPDLQPRSGYLRNDVRPLGHDNGYLTLSDDLLT